MNPVFYDCEASGLDGFPIEVGWAFTEEGTHKIVSESHLIQPLADWLAADNWDPMAEELHGISLAQLKHRGRPVWDVARRMNSALAGRELFSDSVWDYGWLSQLFEGAGATFDFTVRRIDAKVLMRELGYARGIDAEAYDHIVRRLDRLSPRQHRAEQDARHLAIVWQAIIGVDIW